MWSGQKFIPHLHRDRSGMSELSFFRHGSVSPFGRRIIPLHLSFGIFTLRIDKLLGNQFRSMSMVLDAGDKIILL